MRVNAKPKIVGVEFNVPLTSTEVSVSVVEFKSIMLVGFFQKFGVMVGQGLNLSHDMITL
jgi:hypothetical protein